MGARESNPDHLPCRLQGPQAIELAANAARAFASSQRLSADDLARLCIVVEELVANLYDHGGLTDEDEVELDFSRDPDGVRVTLADRGVPFDPWTAPRRSDRPERGGGVGIDIVRAWAEFIGYQATPEGNQLELLLPIS